MREGEKERERERERERENESESNSILGKIYVIKMAPLLCRTDAMSANLE